MNVWGRPAGWNCCSYRSRDKPAHVSSCLAQEWTLSADADWRIVRRSHCFYIVKGQEELLEVIDHEVQLPHVGTAGMLLHAAPRKHVQHTGLPTGCCPASLLHPRNASPPLPLKLMAPSNGRTPCLPFLFGPCSSPQGPHIPVLLYKSLHEG